MLIIYTSTTENHVKRIERRPYTQFHATAKCFKSTLYLLLWLTEKLPLGSLFKTIFPFTFFPFAPGHNRAAPDSSTIRMLWETTEETWRQSLELIVAVKRCGRL